TTTCTRPGPTPSSNGSTSRFGLCTRPETPSRRVGCHEPGRGGVIDVVQALQVVPGAESAEDDAAVFERLYPALRRFAAATGPIETDPDDLVQEAVSRVLRRHALTDLDDPGAYLRRTIANLASNERRGFARWRVAVG